MMAYSEDHIALAAEYALGTLDAEERVQAESMMGADPDFALVVHAWENKLGVLNQMVGSVEPGPEVWNRIKVATGLSGPQAPLVLPEAPPPPAPAPAIEPAPSASADSNVVALSGRARSWRNVASFAGALAASLVALLAVQVFQPDWLPDGLRPKPRTQIVVAKAPAAPAQPAAQYVALLQKDGQVPAFILTVDGATRSFTVRKVGATNEAGKSFELWLISDKLPRPRSLGVIGSGDFTTRPVLASYDADTVKSATYAVTIEQGGGSPNGQPTSPPVYTGKLIETVLPR